MVTRTEFQGYGNPDGPFINLNVSLMLACLGTLVLITVVFSSVSWQTIYSENENAISSLSPINLLLTYI